MFTREFSDIRPRVGSQQRAEESKGNDLRKHRACRADLLTSATSKASICSYGGRGRRRWIPGSSLLKSRKPGLGDVQMLAELVANPPGSRRPCPQAFRSSTN
jgi:hypothetical protein